MTGTRPDVAASPKERDNMDSVRRLAVFVVAIIMVVVGALLLYELAMAHGWALYGGVFSIVSGLGLLWEDFIGPWVKGRNAPP
jgi:hypothetical protein